MPFDPKSRREPRGGVPPEEYGFVGAVPGEPNAAKRFLQRVLPDSWRFANQMALDLARQVRYLDWSARADAFDTYFLRQAEAMLQPKGLTELVNGPPPDGLEPGARRDLEERAQRFATWSRATVTAVLLELDEHGEVKRPAQALTYLLGRELTLAKAAARWTGRHGMGPIGEVLQNLPGYALVLLAASPNDTAERFMARDAFWAAVMKRT